MNICVGFVRKFLTLEQMQGEKSKIIHKIIIFTILFLSENMLKPMGLELNLHQRELVPTATGRYSIQEFIRKSINLTKH